MTSSSLKTEFETGPETGPETAGAMRPGHLGHHDHPHATPWSRLYRLIQIERQDLWVVVAYGVLVGVISLSTPLAAQAVVTTVAFGTLVQPLVVLSLLVVFALFCAGALRVLQLIVVEVLQRRVFLRLVSDLAWRFPRVSLDVLREVESSRIVHRFFDVVTVQKSTSVLLLEGIVLILEVVIGFLLLAFYSPTLLAFSLVLLASVAFVVFGLGRGGVQTAVAESVAKHDVAAWLNELARPSLSLRTDAARRAGGARANELAHRYLDARVAHFRVLLRQNVGAFALQATAMSALLGVGGALVMGGTLTLGQLVAAELIVSSVVTSLGKLGKQLEATYDMLAALDKVGHLVELPVEVQGNEPLSASGAIAISATGLAVASAAVDAHVVLHDVSLRVRPGERVAVVGIGGSGKSALFDVLYGVHAARSGRLAFDDVDVRELAVPGPRIAMVRGAEIFDGSVRDNLRAGRELEVRALIEALRSVDLESAILDRPAGLSTPLLAGGAPLSSSEALRLTLARALLARPGLLLVDGALDGLEAVQRQRLLAGPLVATPEMTIVISTCDPGVAAACDRVLRIVDGTIHEHRSGENS